MDPATVSAGAAERILMVTPYPPLRDGIAAYAVQAVARLRAEGHHVEVLSPGPSAAHHHLELIGSRGPLALAQRARRYDRVIVQYYPGLFHSSDFSHRRWAMATVGLAVAFRAGEVEIRVHETEPSRAKESRLVAAPGTTNSRCTGSMSPTTEPTSSPGRGSIRPRRGPASASRRGRRCSSR